ncbi:MAG: hypothetical protein GX364_08905 [Firmicutes bacterium]|jgi:hypothetical protein|nr:hypothetical protein [Bacillota bacterium]
MTGKDWVLLTEAYNDTEADIICSLLATFDIPARKEYTGPYKGLKVVFGQEIGVEIMVPENLLISAREIIASGTEPRSGQ